LFGRYDSEQEQTEDTEKKDRAELPQI